MESGREDHFGPPKEREPGDDDHARRRAPAVLHRGHVEGGGAEGRAHHHGGRHAGGGRGKSPLRNGFEADFFYVVASGKFEVMVSDQTEGDKAPEDAEFAQRTGA